MSLVLALSAFFQFDCHYGITMMFTTSAAWILDVSLVMLCISELM